MHLHRPRGCIGSLDEDQVRVFLARPIRHTPSPFCLRYESAAGSKSPFLVRRSFPFFVSLDDLNPILDDVRACLDQDEILHEAFILVKGSQQPGTPVVVLEHCRGAQDHLFVVRFAVSDVDLDLSEVGVARLDEDKVQFAVSGRVGHCPGAIVPCQKSGRLLKNAILITGCRRGNVHFDRKAATMSGFDVDQIQFAVTGEVCHHPGPVGLGQEGGSTLPDSVSELGRTAGDMNLDLSGACVTGLDKDEIQKSISIPISRGPHSICFIYEGRPRLEDTRFVGTIEK